MMVNSSRLIKKAVHIAKVAKICSTKEVYVKITSKSPEKISKILIVV